MVMAGWAPTGVQIWPMSTIFRLSLLGTLHLCSIQSLIVTISKGSSIFNTRTQNDFVSLLGSQRRNVWAMSSDKGQSAAKKIRTQLYETKVYETTVAIIPPDEAWGPIQALRLQLRDSGLYRWPPHINLLYPFVPVECFSDACSRLAESLVHIEPFDVTLAELRLFKRKTSATLWLCPEESRSGALEHLQVKLSSK